MHRISFAVLLIAGTSFAVALSWFVDLGGASGATYTVMNNHDSGAGSLRAAITAANANSGVRDTIEFDPAAFPSGAPATISPTTELPASTDEAGLTIDGSGAGVILDGSSIAGTPTGLLFHSSAGKGLADVTVKSLTVIDFGGDGIKVCGGPALTCDEPLQGSLIEDVTIDGVSGNGVYFRGQPNQESVVTHSSIAVSGSYGIYIAASSDDVSDARIEDTSVSGATRGIDVYGRRSYSAHISGVIVTNVGQTAISVEPSEDNVDTTITNSTVSNYTSRGFDIYGQPLINPTVMHVAATGGDYGMELYGGGGVSNAVVRDVTTVGASVAGISVDGSGANSGAELEDVTSSNNPGHGIWINTNSGTLENATLDGCTANNNGGNGITARGVGENSGTDINGCEVSGNGAYGLLVFGGGSTNSASISDSTINGNAGDGFLITANAINDTTITETEANGNQSQGMDIEATGGGIVGLEIEDSESSMNNFNGIAIYAGSESISDTAISNLTANANGDDGVDIFTSASMTNSSITSSTFVANDSTGVDTRGDLTLHFNRIFGNGTGVIAGSSASVDAENNWWGCNDPAALECDTTIGDVDRDPWLVMTVLADPPSIPAGAQSVLAADLTMNSDGTDTSAQGHLPDGTEVELATDFGSVGSQSVVSETADGVAHAQLTANAGPGTAHISATLDNETQTGTVEITNPTPTPVATPTPSSTPGPTPTPSSTPSPTPPPAGELIQGDNDCDGDVDAVDALKNLQHIAAIPFQQEPDCPDIGDSLAVFAPASVPPKIFADVDCDDDVDAVDALKILQFVAALPFTQTEPCTDIGQPV